MILAKIEPLKTKIGDMILADIHGEIKLLEIKEFSSNGEYPTVKTKVIGEYEHADYTFNEILNEKIFMRIEAESLKETEEINI